MNQQRDSTKTFSDIHTSATIRSEIDHPLIVYILGVAFTTIMFRCCTPSPRCNYHRTRTSPVYPVPRPCAGKRTADNMGACVNKSFLYRLMCTRVPLYSLIHKKVQHSGLAAHCPPTRIHIKRPLEHHLRYTRYGCTHQQNTGYYDASSTSACLMRTLSLLDAF